MSDSAYDGLSAWGGHQLRSRHEFSRAPGLRQAAEAPAVESIAEWVSLLFPDHTHSRHLTGAW